MSVPALGRPALVVLVLLFGVAAHWGAASAQGLGGAGAAPAGAEAQKPKTPAEGAPLLLLQPHSMRPEVSVLVQDARKTVFGAAFQGKLGARPYPRDKFKSAFPEGWKHFYEIGKKAAAEHLKSLKPRLVRDQNQVVEYAVIHSDHPLTPAVILAPGFAKLFTATLGEDLLIAVPERSTVIVFPKLANTLERHRAALADLFDDAIYPVSEEVFELTKDGIRAVGAFRAD